MSEPDQYSRRRAIVKLCLVFGHCCCLGCAIQEPNKTQAKLTPLNRGVNQLVQRQSIRRIVILPVENRSGYRDISQLVQASIANSIRQHGIYEVLSVAGESQSGCSVASIEQGAFSEAVLVDSFYRYNADAVLVASLNDIEPYSNLSASVTLHVVDVRTAEVLASIDGIWSDNNEITKRGFSEYIKTRNLDDYRAQLNARSPRLFVEFVANEISHQLHNSKNAYASDSSSKHQGGRSGILHQMLKRCQR